MANSADVASSSASETKPDDIVSRLNDHRDAVAAFAAHLRALSDDDATTPPAAGRWTPAQVTRHLTLTCRAFAAALNTGQDIGLCVSPERSRALYQAIVPRVLAGGWFPRGGVSPEIAMPMDEIPVVALAVDDLAAASGELDDAVAKAFARDPMTRTTHPYFGPMFLPELVSFLAAHVEHHRVLLPQPGRPVAD
jgi:uncharacterized damage-inducible protein DinB